jgi:hypothetical protein
MFIAEKNPFLSPFAISRFAEPEREGGRLEVKLRVGEVLVEV